MLQEISYKTERYFTEAVDLNSHPIKSAKKKTRQKYISTLKFIVESASNGLSESAADIKEFIDARVRLYQARLIEDVSIFDADENPSTYLSALSKPWARKYLYMLVCDAALILLDESLIRDAVRIVAEKLSTGAKAKVERLLTLLFGEFQSKQDLNRCFYPAAPLLRQYKINRDFFFQKEKRFILSANVSAGKSTLINALIGKKAARTAQSVCTGNICRFYNKAFEDGSVHLSAGSLSLSATKNELRGYDWSSKISVASYFAGTVSEVPRVCITDTPGVDSSTYKNHSAITREALLGENFDTVIHVVSAANPTQLGSDSERKHLLWLSENLSGKRIIFVLNKVDNYHPGVDDIGSSIEKFRADLAGVGIADPIICPVSAYVGYLLKLKMSGQNLSEEEEAEYRMYSAKYANPDYDLSRFYEGVRCDPSDSDEIVLSKRIGLYGLEKILYGG